MGFSPGLLFLLLLPHLATAFVPSLPKRMSTQFQASSGSSERDGPSPITTDVVSSAGLSFSHLQAKPSSSGDCGVYYCCRDPKNQGKSTVLGSSQKESGVCYSDPTHNVRSAVHEYGGGSYTVFGDGLLYTDFPSHVVYWKKSGSEPSVQVFPAKGSTLPCRLADFKVVMNENDEPVLLAVMEDHTDAKPSAVVNSVVTVSMDGKATVTTIASGHDFYSAPCHDAATGRVAYVAWDHPNMPWDLTTLYVKDMMSSTDTASSAEIVVHDKASVYAPQWNNNKLYYISNKSGWYNLYSWETDNNKSTALLPMDADFSEGGCGWMLGVRCFTFLSDGRLVASYTDEDGAKVVLINTDDNDDNAKVVEFGRSCLPPTSIASLTVSGDDALYFIGGSTTSPTGIWHWERPGDESCVAKEVVSSMTAGFDLAKIQSFMSEPQPIKFPSDAALGVGYAHGFYYPPVRILSQTEKPPLLVKAHGGPTSRTSTTFRLDIQFWTSRGFAVLDVDYGGSSGYGRDFQQSLQGNWGLLDVADVCNGAKYCVEQGWVNPDFLCIDGSSAGGYTTLAALAFKDTFRAGASLYGIGDLTTLAEGTHKFESRYMDGLIGPYPEKKAIYEERCPVNFTDDISCPVVLLQGDEDKVVPPEQAENMYEVLNSKGLPSALVIYKGEQHGFRKSENIAHALLSEYFFFCETFGLEPQPEGDFSGVKVGARVVV